MKASDIREALKGMCGVRQFSIDRQPWEVTWRVDFTHGQARLILFVGTDAGKVEDVSLLPLPVLDCAVAVRRAFEAWKSGAVDTFEVPGVPEAPKAVTP